MSGYYEQPDGSVEDELGIKKLSSLERALQRYPEPIV